MTIDRDPNDRDLDGLTPRDLRKVANTQPLPPGIPSTEALEIMRDMTEAEALEMMQGKRGGRGAAALTRADEAFRLRLRGMSYRAIAEKLGVAESSVFVAVKKRLKRAADHMAKHSSVELLQAEIERLDGLFLVAWDRAVGAPILDPHTGEELIDDDTGRVQYHDPDPRFIARCESLLQTRAELLGLTKQRVEVTGANGAPLEIKAIAMPGLASMSPAAVAALEVLLARAGLAPAAVDAKGEIVDAVVDESRRLGPAEGASDAPAAPSSTDETEDDSGEG